MQSKKYKLVLEVEDKFTKAHNNIAGILEKENMSLHTIKWQNKQKFKFHKDGVSVKDIQLFVQCIKRKK